MVSEVVVGQQWSLFNAARRQWLLAKVVHVENGKATLEYDPRYDISPPDNLCREDVTSLLNEPRQFRLVE
jgi:hypothetical protein